MKLDGLKRVVTGFEDRRAKITSVSPGGRIIRAPDERGDNWAVCHWISDHPHRLDGEDLSPTWTERLPPPFGAAFRISQFPPAGQPGSTFDFHTTHSVDYFVVLTGKLWRAPPNTKPRRSRPLRTTRSWRSWRRVRTRGSPTCKPMRASRAMEHAWRRRCCSISWRGCEMVPTVGIEPTSSSYESAALPLSYVGRLPSARLWFLLQRAVKRRSLYNLATRCLGYLAAGEGVEPLTLRLAWFSGPVAHHRAPPAIRRAARNARQSVRRDDEMRFMRRLLPCAS